MRIYALVEQVIDGKGVTHDEFRGLTTEENVVKTWLQTPNNSYYMTDDFTQGFKGLCEFFEGTDVFDSI